MASPQLIYADTLESLDIGLPGGLLATSGNAEATYHTNPGEPWREDSLFTFAGTSLVFSHFLGTRTRRIEWSGDVRCSDAGLALLRTRRDLVMRLPGVFTFIDDDGTQYYGCLIRQFFLSPKGRMQDRGLLKWLVGYRIMLEQLQP